MRKLYWTLAKKNLAGNRTLYLPYIIAGVLMVGMFYVMTFISTNPGLAGLPGSQAVQTMMNFGVMILGLFAYIFLFYTNSFIRKNRKKEIGVYTILGMEKRHIGHILALENLVVAAIAILGGILCGIVFSKLAMMLLYKLVGFEESIVFNISKTGILLAVAVFGILYLLIFLFSRVQITLANPVELLRGGNVGEREPKTKHILAIAGILCIAGGYYISFTTKQPIQALSMFFLAVVLVIIGTYLLFMAASIALLKMLRKNKKFYYNKRHFPAVSGMIYRMKQNAAGLASICILSTMVLFVLSTTVSMFAGVSDELDARFEKEINVKVSSMTVDSPVVDSLDESIRRTITDDGRTIESSRTYARLQQLMLAEKGGFAECEQTNWNGSATLVSLMTVEEFGNMEPSMKAELPKLGSGEVAVYGSDRYPQETLSMLGENFRVVKTAKYTHLYDQYIMGAVQGQYFVLVDSPQTLQKMMDARKVTEQAYETTICLGIDGTKEEKMAAFDAVCDRLSEVDVAERAKGAPDFIGWSASGRTASEDDFYALYGGIFFLGLLLGSMFLLVTVMIIFYKQVSEGYEDRNRYRIMENVGMSKTEVKQTISSQIRIVFFLPLVTAIIHVMAAFPITWRLLQLLNLTNMHLFIQCLAITVLVFAVIYTVVFKQTSSVYYHIVGKKVEA